MEKYHRREGNHVCSGVKQRRLVFALFDADSLAGKRPFNLLACSAKVMASQVQPPLNPNKTTLTRDEPVFVNRKTVVGGGGYDSVARGKFALHRLLRQPAVPRHGLPPRSLGRGNETNAFAILSQWL